jgi:hypothetical protein
MAMPAMSYPAAPMVTGSISAPVGGSISASVTAPVSLPASNMFSGYTATPFLPAAGYNPATFGGPVATMSGVPLPTPLASSVASLPMSTGYGYGTTYGAATYAPTTYGAATYAPRTTYAGASYGAPTYSSSYGTTYGATTYATAAPAAGTPTPA